MSMALLLLTPTTGQPLWIPDEKKSIGERLGTAAAVLGGGAILGNYIAPMLSSWASGAGLSVGGTEVVAGSLGMDTAGLDALIAQQEAAYASAATSSGVNYGLTEGATGLGGQGLTAPSAGAEMMYTSPALGEVAPAVGSTAAGAPGLVVPTTAGLAGAAGLGAIGADGVGIGSQAPYTPAIGDPNSPINVGTSPTVTAPGTPGSNGAPPSTGTTPGTQNGQKRSVLDRLLSGEITPDMLGYLISGITGAVQQRNFGQDLLDRAAAATPNREYYEGALRQTYDNPMSYLQGPEYQAAQAITHNKLQRSDAAGGRLANDFGRQVQLQNHALQNLGNYRTGLANMVSQNQQTYSGQNGMFQRGAAADNSWMSSPLLALLSRG